MGRRRGAKTADELLTELENDPDYQQRIRSQEQFQKRFIERKTAEMSAAAAPVVRALKKAGFNVAAPGELRDWRITYPSAVPILLEWLPRLEQVNVREDIVRTLSVPWARPLAAPAMVEEFRREPSTDGLRWAVGNALSIIADDSVFEGVAQIASDVQYGRAREMVALALGNMRDPRAVDTLRRLLNDDDVAGHAVIALGKLRAKSAYADVERFLSHPNAWWRREAKRALAKMDKARPI